MTPAELLWRAWEPGAVYNATFGLETAWRDHADEWGPPMTVGEQTFTVDGQALSGRVFLHVGVVVWQNGAAVVKGWNVS